MRRAGAHSDCALALFLCFAAFEPCPSCCKLPATWDRALGDGTGRILPDGDAGTTGNEERVIGQRSNAYDRCQWPETLAATVCRRGVNQPRSMAWVHRFYGGPCLSDVTAYSARSMIHQERPDTLISSSMSIARTNNIRYLRFA